MNATTVCATLLLAMAASACGQGREVAVPAARAEDILGTPSAVAPRQSVEPRWVRIDSTERATLWLDTESIAPAGTDTFIVWTAFRFPTPTPGRSAAANRLAAEGRLRHLIECRDRRMRTLDYDTRDTAGAVVEVGRLNSEWLRPFQGSGYGNLIDLVCEFKGIPRPKAT